MRKVKLTADIAVFVPIVTAVVNTITELPITDTRFHVGTRN